MHVWFGSWRNHAEARGRRTEPILSQSDRWVYEAGAAISWAAEYITYIQVPYIYIYISNPPILVRGN